MYLLQTCLYTTCQCCGCNCLGLKAAMSATSPSISDMIYACLQLMACDLSNNKLTGFLPPSWSALNLVSWSGKLYMVNVRHLYKMTGTDVTRLAASSTAPQVHLCTWHMTLGSSFWLFTVRLSLHFWNRSHDHVEMLEFGRMSCLIASQSTAYCN